MTKAKPKRSRFSFSLRTLFVVVTLMCVWLGYELNWQSQRLDFIRMDAVEPPYSYPHMRPVLLRRYTIPGIYRESERPLPIVCRIFGDHAYSTIYLPEQYNQELAEKASMLFPEAQIINRTKGGPRDITQF